MALASFPLLIAIVGQQEVVEQDAARIRSVIQTIIKELQNTYPHTAVLAVTPGARRSEQVAMEAVRDAGIPVIICEDHAVIASAPLLLALWDGTSADVSVMNVGA